MFQRCHFGDEGHVRQTGDAPLNFIDKKTDIVYNAVNMIEPIYFRVNLKIGHFVDFKFVQLAISWTNGMEEFGEMSAGFFATS
jgi:hypothetical protein